MAAEDFFSKELIASLGVGGAVAMSLLSLGVAFAGATGKWLLGERSAKNKVRLDFAGATGAQIASLANEHYWAIATAAGTLSVGLRDYLEAVEIRLYLYWDSSSELCKGMEPVAEKSSKDTFASLIQLLWSLNDFQFTGSNDYLLPHRAAGTHLRRLYNQFRTSLTSLNSDMVSTIINEAVVVDGKLDVRQTVIAILAGKETCQSWTDWLHMALPDVLRATEALEAFSRLLQYELAELYEDWFRDDPSAGEFADIDGAVRKHRWFGMLDQKTEQIILEAREQPDFLTPLRTRIAGAATPAVAVSQSAAAPMTAVMDQVATGPAHGRQDGPQPTPGMAPPP